MTFNKDLHVTCDQRSQSAYDRVITCVYIYHSS